MYHQPEAKVKRLSHRKSTKPARILHVVGRDEYYGFNIVHPAKFRSWSEVAFLGERAYIIRVNQDLHVIYSEHYRTWGRA